MKTPDYLKTEEGKKVKYNKEYFTVFFLEQEATKGTPNKNLNKKANQLRLAF